MPRQQLSFLAVISIFLSSWLFVPTANSQSVTLGGDDNQIFQILRSNGYTQGRVVKRKLTITHTNACKGGNEFLVKISILGRITSQTKIGRCKVAQQPGSQFLPRDAVSLLQNNGYAEIRAEINGRSVKATACRQNRRFEIAFNRRGQIIQQRDIGSCLAVGLNKAQIKEILEGEGLTRIVITDERLPKYVAEACRNSSRVRVTMNRRGRVRSERRIGECGLQFNPDNIATVLGRSGYDRIEVIDRRRPPYIAHACQGDDRMEIEIGRYGRILRKHRIRSCRSNINPQNMASILGKEGYDRVRVLRGNRAPYLVEACRGDVLNELTVGRFGRVQKAERVGTCANPITESALRKKLSKQGFSTLTLNRQNYGWRAEVCRNETKVAIRIDAYGDAIRERNLGQCVSKSVLDILKTLESRGADRTQVQIIGCYRNNKYRWTFDRLGNRTGRDRIGGC